MLDKFTGMQRGGTWALTGLLCAFFVFSALQAFARDDFRNVEPEDLLKNPQNYWSLGILFRDKLTAHTEGRRVRIGDRFYTEFMTERLGTCYADQDLVHMLDMLPLGREYLFTGTVLNRDTFMSRRPAFCVVAQDVTESISDKKDLNGSLLKSVFEIPAGAQDETAAIVARVFSMTHGALFAYAREKDLELWELFEPDSEHSGKVADIIHGSLLAIQREDNVTAVEILGEFVRGTLTQYYQRPGRIKSGAAEKETVKQQALTEPKPIALKMGVKLSPAARMPVAGEPAPETVEPETPPSSEKAVKPVTRSKIPLDYELPVGR